MAENKGQIPNTFGYIDILYYLLAIKMLFRIKLFYLCILIVSNFLIRNAVLISDNNQDI